MTTHHRGFTLIELLVSVSIIVVLTALVVFNYNGVNGNLALSDGRQNMALFIRQAQVYSTSVKQVDTNGNFTTPYGFFINLNDSSKFYLFADRSGNNTYDYNPAGASENIETGSFKNNVRVTSICGTTFAGSYVCPIPGVASLSIVFVRPDPTPHIYLFDGSGVAVSGSYQSVDIILTSQTGGKTALVRISGTGQISLP